MTKNRTKPPLTKSTLMDYGEVFRFYHSHTSYNRILHQHSSVTVRLLKVFLLWGQLYISRCYSLVS